MNKCSRCHCKRIEDDFYKNGKRMKTCDLCRVYNKNYRDRYPVKVINKDDVRCRRCKRPKDDFNKTCDLCRVYNKNYYDIRKNKKKCIKCNVLKDKDKFVYRKITYDSCIACLLKARANKKIF